MIAIILQISFVNAICGDNICEKGLERATISINYTGFITTSNISTGQSINFNINNNEISFYLRLLSVNRETKLSTFDYNGTNINLAIRNTTNLTDSVSLTVENLTLSIDNEEVICPNDCVQCNANAECDDKNQCTTDVCEGTPKKCAHKDVPNCIANAFIKFGEKFALGNGTCKRDYRFISGDAIKKQIFFEKSFPQSKLNLSYINKTSNQYGFLIELKDEVLGRVFTYNLRYDENKSLLYIGEAILACPFVDACISNKDCDDKDVCTIDECDGTPLRCKYKRIAYCKSDDGCCPAKCTYLNDNDCANPNKCNTDLDCFDNETCTTDRCIGEPRLCQNAIIVDCVTGDNCCAKGCNYYEDQDCIRPIVCGDKLCEGNESLTCCTDCGCSEGKECVNNTCVKPLIAQAGELLNKSIEVSKAKKELSEKNFKLKDTLIVKNQKGGIDFSYVYEKQGKFAFINGTIDNNKILVGEFQSPVRHNYLYLIGIVSAIVLLGSGTGLFVHKKRKEKRREEYYARLLHQRYVMPQRMPYYHRHHGMRHRQLQQTMRQSYQRQYPPQRQYQQQMWRR